MYCANCGTSLVGGLSYCNRCGADLRERKESKHTGAISAFLTAITLIAAIGFRHHARRRVGIAQGSRLEPGVDRLLHVVYVSDRRHH